MPHVNPSLRNDVCAGGVHDVMMGYELIIFDLGGVVVDVESDRLVHHVSQLVGRSFEEVQAEVYHEDLLGRFELGQITPQDYYEGLRRRISIPWTYEQFVRSWNGICTENRPVTDLLQRLHGRYKLTALSNTNALHLRHIQETIPTLSVIQDWVASCDVGCRKPNPMIYELALERVAVTPEAAVYVDDRPELVEAGRKVGLTAIRFEDGQQLERELRAAGVTC